MATANLSDNNDIQNISGSKTRRFAGTVSSPWSEIVRGESETIVAVPSSPNKTSSTAAVEPVYCSSSSPPLAVEEPVGEFTENGNGSDTNAGKKPAWNKLSNGSLEVGPVMGAASWPALSDSTRISTKSSSESLKGLVDGSDGSAWQGSGNPSSVLQKEVSTNASPNSSSTPTPTHPMASRQKSMKRNGASNSNNSGISQQSVVPSSVIDTAQYNPSKDQTQKTSSASQSHNDHGYQQQRNSFRSRNGGSHQRGDTSHHHNHGARRDHDRGNQDWNSHRNFNGQPQRVFQRFIRPPPPPSTASYIPPPPVRPLGSPIPFSEFAPPMVYVTGPHLPEALRGVPFVTPIPPNPMFFPASDLQLNIKIIRQIEYYFSAENLIKDTFLRKNMDEFGWVPIKLVAGFNKVLCLTDNIQLILDVLQSSFVVEVQGDKVRRRNDWSRWIMPSSAQISNVAGTLSPGNSSMLAAGIQNLSLETIIHSSTQDEGDVRFEAQQNRSPGNMSSQSQAPGLDHSFSSKN